MAVSNTSIKLTEFSSMSKQQRKNRVDALFESAINPTSDQLSQWIEQVDDEIQQYESQYKMSSDDMLQSLKTGEASGFPDICSWLMLLNTRSQICYAGKVDYLGLLVQSPLQGYSSFKTSETKLAIL